jgi:hypothetical protein
VPEIDMEKEPQNGLRWLMTEEVQGLVDACRKSRNTTLADLVEFALFTGVRRASRSGSHRGTSTGLVVSSARRSKPRRPPKRERSGDLNGKVVPPA